jgi:hypothetical protein
VVTARPHQVPGFESPEALLDVQATVATSFRLNLGPTRRVLSEGLALTHCLALYAYRLTGGRLR